MNSNANQLTRKIAQTKSNIENALSRSARSVSSAFQQAKNRTISNTQNLHSNISRSMNSSNSSSPSSLLYFILGLLMILMVVVLVIVVYYMMTECKEKKSLYDYVFDMSSPCIVPLSPDDLSKEKKSEFEFPKIEEVFHIANQDYTYDQAKCKCKAYGARLATKEDMIDAFNNGADWCTYGWSEGQQAFFPTQQSTWEELQYHPNRKNDCGRPGVNGGEFVNPEIKFGVNCYGMKTEGKIIREKSPSKQEFCAKKGNFQAGNILETDRISPFNHNRWNQ